jgi:PAS domain S-box-containing protein
MTLVEKKTPLRLLHVEDAENDAHLLVRELERCGYDLTYTRVEAAKEMRSELAQQTWDVIISDHIMPGFSAPLALDVAKELAPQTPFLILSGEIDLNLAVLLLKSGAHDYITKDELIRVPMAIAREMEAMAGRKRAEEERRASEEKFYKAFQNSPDAININRLSDGVYLAVNEGFERSSGYPAEEVIGKSTLELNIWANPEDRARLAKRLLEKGFVEYKEVLIRHRDGRVAPSLGSSRLLMINGEQCVISVTRDLTQQKQAEESLRRLNAELQAINRITAAVTTQLDIPILLKEALRGALSIAGLESGAIYLWSPGDQVFYLASSLYLKPTHAEFELKRDSFEEMSGDARAEAEAAKGPVGIAPFFQVTFPLTNNQSSTGMMCLRSNQIAAVPPDTLDLLHHLGGTIALALENARLYETVQRHAEELEEHVAERTTQLSAINQELEAFSYSAAHDLRAPLRVIDGYSQILLTEDALSLAPEGRERLSRIVANVARMQKMLDALLALSRLTQSSLHREALDISAMAHDVANELIQRDSARAIAWCIEPGLLVQGDRLLLRTVLENLLGNAWKFTAPRAQASIVFGKLDASTPPGETIYFVRDNGAGFDMARASQLFQVFRRLHADNEFPGTGIGLASVKRILHRHGGRIWAEGAPGRGATFYFTVE